MSNLSIKDVPEAWAQSLRQRATRHHCPLQGELMAIIEPAVQMQAERLTNLATFDVKPSRTEQELLAGLV